jgi:oligopeptidase A
MLIPDSSRSIHWPFDRERGWIQILSEFGSNPYDGSFGCVADCCHHSLFRSDLNMSNPLLDLSGLPRFTHIQPKHVEPAVESVLDENRRQIDDITGKSQPGWENVVAPMEQMEHRLSRVWAPVGHLNAVMNSPDLRAAYNECLPMLSDYATTVGQNENLFRAYEAVAESSQQLTPAQRKVIENALRDFRLAGVDLPAEQKLRFKAIMQELSTLQARFEENLLDATNAWSRQVVDRSELGGLPEAAMDLARETAQKNDQDGWLFKLDFPNYHAILTHAENRALRREFYEAWVTRASELGPDGGRWDNTPVMDAILRLRHEASVMLGFDCFAQYSLATKMAGSVEEVLGFLNTLADESHEKALAEMNELRKLVQTPLEAWDVAYYSERLRQERFDISDEELRPYFPVERVIAGMLETASLLFGVEIRQSQPPDRWHPDVDYYELYDQSGLRGSFYIDLYARARKRGGAWMDDCVGRAKTSHGVDHPVAFLVCNFMPASGDRPPLLTHDEVVTLFHEFGHTLHHLLTRIDFPSVSGINGVAWDAVELPSQFFENFAWRPEVLPLISGHYKSGDPLPEAMLERLIDCRKFQAGMQMAKQLEFALFDLTLHSANHALSKEEVNESLKDVRSKVSVVPCPEFNRFANGFCHVFGGGYAAGYYSYKWAEVLSADAFSAFEETAVLDRETGRRFMESVLEVGGSVDAMDAFIAFRGRRPRPDALLRLSGITDQ